MKNDLLPPVQPNIPLAPFTTIKLGGPAQYFIDCPSTAAIQYALAFAQEQRLPLHVMGGGSNTVFSDAGFAGLVAKISLRSLDFHDTGRYTEVTAAAGEPWDQLVAAAVARGLGGLENMSGIPGTVGAAPVQNVGAYGQEVAQVITSVNAINRATGREITFKRRQCQFGYRTSRFKVHHDKFIITGVTLRLNHDARPTIAYPDVLAEVGGPDALAAHGRGVAALNFMRTAVLNVRRRKSMVIDPADPNSRSCGSFFVNPVVTKAQFARLQKNSAQPVPSRTTGPRLTVPAAWLLENAGYPKGYRQHGVGISSHHNLALVNYGGTAAALLALAYAIQVQVKKKFGLQLEIEPVII